MNRWELSLAAIGATVCVLVGGCGESTRRAPPLDTTFDRTATDARRAPMQDRSGALAYDNLRTADAPAAPEGMARGPLTGNGNGSDPAAMNSGNANSTNLSPAVEKQIRGPREEAMANAGIANAPNLAGNGNPNANGNGATTRGVGQGQVMLLGAVVVDVNGKPIFVSDVFETIAPVLYARAEDLDERRYRAAAAKEIQDMVMRLIRSELEYAAADRSLDSNEKRIADVLTGMDRETMIRKAGGSEQLARRATAAQGLDFDKVLEDRRRLNMVRVYYQKRELPRIQVTAEDMRQYHAKHINDVFTEKSSAQFRVIKIDIAKTGSDTAARSKADDILSKARAGQDFAALAGSFNDDPFLARNKGDVTGKGGWTDKGAYANEKVEAAVWALHPGQITDVIETPGAFYIAKLEARKDGRVQSFDEQDVQARCRAALEDEQMTAARDRMTQRLMKDAIISPDPPRMDPVLEIAMQKYREWSTKK